MKKIITVIFISNFLWGCSQYSYVMGNALPPRTSVDWTDKALGTLMIEFGPPHHIARAPNGYFLAWEAVTVTETSAGLGLGVFGLNALQADWSNATASGDFLLVRVDQDGQVTEFSREDWQRIVGTGAGVQPIAAVAPLVDVDAYLTSLPQHEWGSALLLPIQQAQNMHSIPNISGAGIEQRGTPSAIGQKVLSLE